MSQIITPDDFDFRAYMVETEPQVRVVPAETWRATLIDHVRSGERITGATLPWSKTHDHIRFRPGEVTLWQGINGHGKSELLGQVTLGFGAQGERSCTASFEMKPQNTLKRWLRQTAMNDTPSEKAVHNMFDWSRGKLWLYDQVGSVKPEMVYAVMRYCAEKLKIQHMIIDSLMKCVRGEDDHNGQKDFVDMLCSLSKDLGLHVHLVHHAKKKESEDVKPGKFDAKGSGAIVDQVDQLLTVWRNKKKERQIVMAQRIEDDAARKAKLQELDEMPDSLLICDKNRNGEWEGQIGLWRHAPSLQFTGDNRRMPLDLIGWNA
ncbi:AAA family ATPase [Allopusillimonas ginsengisoli]|uniref:AAA family ATPase n=1 Tax=Allopusillimonas ginsengisoli TaxID=453575 RepID=UPI0039C099A9